MVSQLKACYSHHSLLGFNLNSHGGTQATLDIRLGSTKLREGRRG